MVRVYLFAFDSVMLQLYTLNMIKLYTVRPTDKLLAQVGDLNSHLRDTGPTLDQLNY